ncbi:hypothetical protein HK097_010478, partial [Rhizophlyctis rosea]
TCCASGDVCAPLEDERRRHADSRKELEDERNNHAETRTILEEERKQHTDCLSNLELAQRKEPGKQGEESGQTADQGLGMEEVSDRVPEDSANAIETSGLKGSLSHGNSQPEFQRAYPQNGEVQMQQDGKTSKRAGKSPAHINPDKPYHDENYAWIYRYDYEKESVPNNCCPRYRALGTIADSHHPRDHNDEHKIRSMIAQSIDPQILLEYCTIFTHKWIDSLPQASKNTVKL